MLTQTRNVEEKLYFNRFVVDAGRPHITVRPHERPSAELRSLTHMCPAGCYSQNEAGQVEIATDGCLECGTCRIVTARTGEVEWNYPRGGFGILYKFG
ncbi:ferredoxin family protein [Novosphingobium sp. PC22D]|uniref:ferredoxin family protein n=1 Tax=Novosphingobium sp. PC22D TaxID=1962403 RepID=UPI000BF01FB2|nr:ferredoxin family protein [Novosphingobium sp. PC22D]PEQ14466.1 ferredoxin family protein [Novosphingobium sp. PC22D]